MNHTLLERAKVFLQAHKNKSIWHRITTSLAAVVVFVTTYMLILPAITMERPTVCGLEEHTHTKACYASSLKAALHEHDASCYDANGSLVCQRPVVRLHEHTDECYKDSNLICGQIAYQGHTHTDACYTWEKVLVCGDGAGSSINADGEILIDEGAAETPQTSAHVHTDDCYRMEKVLTCLLAEGQGHTHTAACYDGPRQLICGHDGMAEIIWPDSPVEYVSANDTGKILICGKKEHKHTDSCYADETPQSETKAQTEPQTIVVAETEAVTEPQVVTETEAEAQIATEAQTEPATETQIATEAQTELVTETQNTTEAETQVVTETEAVTEPQVATEVETQIATEAQTEQVTETQIATEAQTEPVTETQIATEAQTEPVTEAQNTTEAETQVATETEAETELETETEMETEIATETTTEVAAESEPETEFSTEIESESETVSEAETESGTEIQTETETEAETETETETEAESEIGTEAETEIETETESDTESETEIESETGTWTDEALKEAFKDGTIDSYCVAQHRESSGKQRRKVAARGAVEQGAVEFGQYLTNATVQKKENGQWITSTEFDDGDQVKVTLNYSIPKGKITAEQKQIYYQLPSGVHPLERQTGMAYHGNEAVGTYVIDTDGMITIDFYDKFANGEAFTGNIGFAGTVIFAGSGENGQISFGGATTGITIKKPEDIKTEKTGIVSADKESISYTVKVFTEKGTSDTVSIEDYFSEASGNLKGEYKPESFKIYKVNASGQKTELSGYNPEIQTGGTQQSFKFSNLPKLEAGESYEVTYQANVAQTGNSNQSNDGAGSIKNTAVAKSGNLQSEKSQTIEISKKMVAKRGYQDNDVIKWNITVNEDKRDIRGYSLNDVFPEGVNLVGEYVINDGAGREIARGNSFPYTFSGENPMNDTYTVTFNTTIPDTNGAGRPIINTATLRNGNKEYKADGTAWVSHKKQDWDLSKGYQGTRTENGTVRCKWRTGITLPDGKTESFIYEDTIFSSNDENTGNHYVYASELVSEIKNSLKLQIKGVDGEKGFENNGYAEFEILCYDANGNPLGNADNQTPVKNFKVKVKPTSEFYGRKLYFDYTTIADTSGMQSGDTLYFKNGGTLEKGENGEGGTLKDTETTGDYTKPRPEWGLSKTFSQETAQDGEVRYKWETNISLPAGTAESFTYTDTILEPDSSKGDYEKGDYHYAYAPELIQAIKSSLRLKLQNGTDIRLTDDQGTDIENDYVEITINCYDADCNPVTDGTAHVQSFKVEVTKKDGSAFEWQSLYFNYMTAVDYSKIQSGETWTFKNKGELDKDNKQDTASHDHTSSNWELSKKLYGSVQEDGKASCEWESAITLPENEKKEFTYTDTILEPEGSDGDYHYAYASELVQAIKDSLKLKIKNGSDISFGSDQGNASVNFEVICYDVNNQVVDNQDSMTHVQRFEVKVKPNIESDFQWESLTFRYKTVADYSEMKKGDTRKFQNQGEVENKTSKDEYTYTRPNQLNKAVSKDGRYTSEDVQMDLTALKNDELSYRLLITTTADENGDITITDTLPSGATYVEGSIAGYFYASDNHHYQKRYNAAYDFGNDAYRPVVKINQTENGQQMVITVKGGYNVAEAASETKVIELQYKVSVNGDPFWKSSKNESREYTNHASWKDNSASQTTEVRRKEAEKLKKEATQLTEKADGTERSTNRVKYTIQINPAGKDLDPNSNKLILKDKLTKEDGAKAEADLELDTVKLYYLDESKEDKLGGLIAVSDYSLQYDEANHQMTLTIPDETPCILVYVYAMDVGSDVEPTYKNKAELVGIYSTETDSKLTEVGSSAGVQKKRINVYKVDSKNHTQLLNGAVFKLESWKNGEWKGVPNPVSDPDNADRCTYVAENGHLELNEAVGGDGLAYNVLYKVTEVTAPVGYAKTDQAYYFIYMDPVSNPDAKTDVAWDAAATANSEISKENVMFVGKDGKTIYVPNQANSIKVQKVWADSKGQEVQQNFSPVTVSVRRSIRRPNKCSVTVKFISNAHTNPEKDFPAFLIEKGTNITFLGTVDWATDSNNAFIWVKINGQEVSVNRQNNLGKYGSAITTPTINEDCTITLYVNGNGKAYDFGKSAEELMDYISYTSPKSYTEYNDPTFGTNGEKKIVLSKDNNWSTILENLDITNTNGDQYYYTVEEVGGSNYNVVYTNNGIQTGTIYIKNTIPDKENSYILPETGGPGSRMYMIGGAVLALLAVILLYIKTVSRRCMADCATPSENDHFRNDCSGLLSGESNKRGKEDSKSP